MGPQFFVDGGFVCTYKGITRLLGRGSVRITPARAGKRRLPDVQAQGPGSPPHTRGKAVLTAFERRFPGITPAHAGKRRSSGCSKAHAGKSLLVSRSRWSTGSPPHTRGKGQPERSSSARDHPRTRGEKSGVATWLGLYSGSPPHTRGKVISNNRRRNVDRITPAHAGKSSRCRCWWLHSGDHPRTRGEKRPDSQLPMVFTGSPPHTRGKATGIYHD